MNFVTIGLLVSVLLPFVSGEDINNGRVSESIYKTNRVKRNSQEAGTPRDWQWYLKDTPVSMNVKSAWQAGYTGKGVLVAVVDDGVNMNHPDLQPNFNVDASYDVLKNRPISRSYSPGSHGTNCAGIIAGGNNSNCGVGIAFGAQIAGIRLFDENSELNDESNARALSYKTQLIDIYSNSWGPGDMGVQVEGPGPRLTEALKRGTRMGRRGKGSIFVFAAGNGGLSGDSCAFSGYVNSIYTIAISGVNWDGAVPVYAEKCAAIMAVTYGHVQDIFTPGNVKAPMITTEGDKSCTEDFSGTSGTTAMASGIIALALEANRNLTWRDVQHLIARSSKPLDPPSVKSSTARRRRTPSWKTNAANLRVSQYYGFGLMDANMLVEYAKNWTSVPEQLTCEVELYVSYSAWPQIPWSGQLPISLNVNEQSCGIRYLEHVQVQVDLTFPRRGYLEMSSVSPSKTHSRLLYPRAFDSLAGLKNFTNWTVTSLHYWGENPVGTWNLIIRNTKPWRKNRNVLGQPRSDSRAVGKSKRAKSAPTKVDGRYSHWSSWSQCNATCGSGTQQRSRSCTNPPPPHRGTQCKGPAQQTQICTSVCPTPGIPINGGYSPWSYWSRCSKSCDGGSQHRSRSCTNPPPANDGKDCSRLGQATESRKCNTKRCPVDGGYSKWSRWDACSKSCDEGYQRRYRSCTNPPPAHGGQSCWRLGQSTESRQCNTHKCPGHLFYLKLILYGTKEDPLTNNRHVDRRMKNTEKVQIDQRRRDIPIHGGYSHWSYWHSCNKPCGGGTQHRYRYCTNPPPANKGRDCSALGPATESRRCNTHHCPVDGGYSLWSAWSSCSHSCNGGTQGRHRFCTNPPPAHRGRDCRRLGRATESRSCNTQSCPVIATNTSCQNIESDANCTSWERFCKDTYVWHNCPKTCGTCPVDGRYSQWTLWSPCSVTCGAGTQQRTRSCNNPPPANGGASCRGPAQETQKCRAPTMCPRPTVTQTQSCQNAADDGLCNLWKDFCNTDKDLQRDCAKTCGKCKVCKNSLSDSYCNSQPDGCSNAIFKAYCKKTCGVC
ncbi:uncharacterized protein LOC144639494 isoform X2 [Oculina patagonica]